MTPVLDVSLGETLIGKYSTARALRSYLSSGEARGVEGEVSAELTTSIAAVTGRERGGLVLPAAAFLGAAATLSSAIESAGALVFRVPSEVRDAPRPVAAVERLGATVITGEPQPLSLVRMERGGKRGFLEELPAEPIEDDDSIRFHRTDPPLTTGYAAAAITRQLAGRGTPLPIPLVERDLRLAVASLLDKGGIAGSGAAGEPRGILNTNGIGDAGQLDPPTYSALAGMEAAAAGHDLEELAPGWLTTPAVRRILRETPELGAGGTRPTWRGGSVLDHPAIATNHAQKDLGETEDEHGLVFSLDWSFLVIQVLGVEVVLDEFTSKKRGVLEMSVFVYMSAAALDPRAFEIARVPVPEEASS